MNSNNPAWDAWAAAKHGSTKAAAKALGIKRTTIGAWAMGRNSCPGHYRMLIEQRSAGAVPRSSWDDAVAAFRRSQRSAA